MDDAIRRTLADAADFLDTHSVPFAIIGGIAVTVRGEPRFTADVDAIIGVEIDRALGLLKAVDGSAFTPLFSDAADVVQTSFILPIRHRDTRIKVDLAIGLTGFEKQLLSRAELVDFGGVCVPVASAEDLLIMKILAGRPRDTEDAQRIVDRQGEQLDWDFILDVGKQLQEAVGQELLSQLRTLRGECR